MEEEFAMEAPVVVVKLPSLLLQKMQLASVGSEDLKLRMAPPLTDAKFP